jgi:hypothetical protein
LSAICHSQFRSGFNRVREAIKETLAAMDDVNDGKKKKLLLICCHYQ